MENNHQIQNPQSQNKLYWIYLAGFFIILSLPLLNLQPWFAPPDWGKTTVFRIVLSALIFLFIWQLLGVKKRLVNSCKLKSVFLPFWLLIIFGGLVLLSSAFSPEPHYSFWASPYRSGGSLNFTLYIFFAILIFLVLKEKDWMKLWSFSIIIGLLVSTIAILQHLHLFSKILIPYTVEIPSTIGGPIFLGIYLLLLSLPTLAFALTEKGLQKKIFYFASFFVFTVVILLTNSQAAYLGFAVGSTYFLFFFPKKNRLFKRVLIFLMIFGVACIFFLKTHPEISLNQKPIIRNLTSWEMDPSRLSAWRISLKALKDRPILGYGLENFSIPFDKYYDPSLPAINRQPGVVTGWWDKAHNIFFEIALTVGIPALIIYISFFGILLFLLQKLKHHTEEEENNKKIIYHGIQATIVGYFVADFFSFDTASTYLLLFLIIAYSLHLISLNSPKQENTFFKANKNQKRANLISRSQGFVSAIILILIILFIWLAALKPFKINKEINWAVHYSKTNRCQKAIDTMEKILPSHTIIDNYLRLQYINVIRNCMFQHPKQRAELAKKNILLLEETKKTRPTYTRTWLFLGTYINIFVESSPKLDPKIRKNLLKKADSAFQKAADLSPKHQEIWVGWIKTDLLSEKYQEAEEKAQHCIDLNQKLPDCWWAKALAHIYQDEISEATKDMEIAIERGYSLETKSALIQLLNAYVKIEDEAKDENYYTRLAGIYEKLIKYDPDNFQYHASLAYVYKMLNRYRKAIEESIYVFMLSPESRIAIEEFLDSLPGDSTFIYRDIAENYKILLKKHPRNSGYHLSLAFVYKMLGEYQKAKKEAEVALELSFQSDESEKEAIKKFLDSISEF